MSDTSGAVRRDHGWWPYLLPMVAFLGLAEIERRSGASPAAFLVLKAAVPGALVVAFALRGGYPELRGYGAKLRGMPLDLLVGVLGAALWMAPYVVFPSLQPEGEGTFDPTLLGPDRVATVLVLRALGYGLVTPFVEELFVRSFVPRLVDAYSEWRDFRTIPIARFTWPSFAVVVVYFTFSHVPWEWPVAAAWIVLTQLWFYHRRHVASLIVVHAGSNLSILAAVAWASACATGSDGQPLDWWFFV